MGKSRLAPGPRHDHIRGNRVRPIIQIDQMFQTLMMPLELDRLVWGA
jgi:hypothetical protein